MGKLLDKRKIQSFSAIGAPQEIVADGTISPVSKFQFKKDTRVDGYLAYNTFTFSDKAVDNSTLTIKENGSDTRKYTFKSSVTSNGYMTGTREYEVHCGVDAFSAAWNFEHAISGDGPNANAGYVQYFIVEANVRGVGVVDIWTINATPGEDMSFLPGANFNDNCSVNRMLIIEGHAVEYK